ncbi:hypothetical protein XENOCAPTIV_028278, partial [Xenoophorus captivus]
SKRLRFSHGLCCCAAGSATGDRVWPFRKGTHSACTGQFCLIFLGQHVTPTAFFDIFFLTSRICFCVFHQHPDRKEERCFVPYKPPPEDGSPAEVEEFLEHVRFIAEDLEWLLALPHDKFWCQVVFDESLQRCLDSYLHHAPRGLDVATLPLSPAVADVQRAELGDIVLYLCDSTTTIHAFLDIFPAACSSFHSHGFLSRFLVDYDEQFPIADDISLLQQALPVIDETRTSYLLQGVESAWDSTGRRRPQGHIQNNGASSFSTNQGAAGGTAASSDSFGPQEVKESRGEGAVCPVSGPELESLLSCIGDLLPDLGEGFLLACLQEYDYNSELVINNILEDRLVPDLEKLDRAMPR